MGKTIILTESQVKFLTNEDTDDYQDDSYFDKNSKLNGMSNDKARKYVRNVATSSYHTGLYRDDFWIGPNGIMKNFKKNEIDYILINSKYYNYPPRNSGDSSGKKWELYFPFINNKGNKTVLAGEIIAAGAGSVSDPLDAYDVNFTIY